MKAVFLLALLASAILTQVPTTYTQNLIRDKELNNKIRERLNDNCGAKADDRIKKIAQDIEDNGFITFLHNQRRIDITQERPSDYSTNPTVNAAIKEAKGTPGQVVYKVGPVDNWEADQDKEPTHSQTIVYAVSKTEGSFKVLDYFHLEYRLILKGTKVYTTEDYQKAMSYVACDLQKQWVTKSFPAAQ